MPPQADLKDVHGQSEVIEPVGRDKQGLVVWECKCLAPGCPRGEKTFGAFCVADPPWFNYF
jgi:hypothetical protein